MISCTLELLQIYMYFETKIIQRSQSVSFDLFLENPEGRIYAITAIIWQTKELLFTVFFWEKKCLAKNEHIPRDFFFVMNRKLTHKNNVMKQKLKNSMSMS